MEPTSTVSNPDAFPEATGVDELASRLLREARRAYWVIVEVGIAFCGFALLVNTLIQISKGPQPFDPARLAPALWLLFFAYLEWTAASFENSFEQVYRRARWSAVIASGVFFPVLTLPGMLAVRRLEEYHKFLADGPQAES